jgi:hypothetical protein
MLEEQELKLEEQQEKVGRTGIGTRRGGFEV